GALEYEPLQLSDIFQDHVSTAMAICGKTKILKMFDKYLKIGYYPYFTDAKNDFLIRLAETAKLVIENDLPAVLDVNYAT
ncbi:MAG TPA: AAA family ATPase, partial [Rikenellaceae bacterium]|nr:AAA family ATPase [Rikenellaceae bacterium]